MTLVELLFIGLLFLTLFGLGRMGVDYDDSWPWYAYTLGVVILPYGLYLIARFADFDRRRAIECAVAVVVLIGLTVGLQVGAEHLVSGIKDAPGASDKTVAELVTSGGQTLYGYDLLTVLTVMTWTRRVLGVGLFVALGYLFYYLARAHERNVYIALILWGTFVPLLPLIYISWPHIQRAPAQMLASDQ